MPPKLQGPIGGQWKPAHSRLGVGIRTSKRDVCSTLSGRNVLARLTGTDWGKFHNGVDLSEWS